MHHLKILLLNASYLPLKVVGWESAVTMVYLNKVDVLAEYEVQVHSQHETWNIPAVIRLRKNAEFFLPAVKFRRDYLFTRDGFKCQYCGKTFRPKELTYDHVIPRSKGGSRTWENIITCCVPCNQKKGNKTPVEAKMPLLKKPQKPRWFPALLAESIRERRAPDEWEPYIGWLKDKSNGAQKP